MRRIRIFAPIVLALFSVSVSAPGPVYDLNKNTVITWTGQLATQSVHPSAYNGAPTQDTQETSVCLLNLNTPVALKSESNPDLLLETQVEIRFGTNSKICEKLKGETITVTGALSEERTGHQMTKSFVDVKVLERRVEEKIFLKPNDTPFTVRYLLTTQIEDGSEFMRQIDVLDQTYKTLYTKQPGYYLLQDSHFAAHRLQEDSVVFASAEDANQDGLDDLSILSDRGITLGGCYDYGVFDAKTKILVFKKDWQRLCNPTWDTEEKTLTTTEQYGIGKVQEEIIKTYSIRGSRLVLLNTERFKEESSE